MESDAIRCIFGLRLFTPLTSTSRNIARSALWNHVGKVAEYGLLYASSVIIARSLGVEENGRFAGVLSVVQLLLVFGSFGIETALNTHLPQLTGPAGPSQGRYIVHRAVALRFALISILVLPVGLAVMLIGKTRVSIMEFTWVMLGLAMIRGVASVLAAVLTTHLRTAATSTVNVLARSMELLALLALAPAGLSVLVTIIVMIGGAAVQICGYMVCERGEWSGGVQRVPVKPLVVFGGVFWINTLVDYFLGRQGDIFLLTLLLPTSEPASLYDVAYSVMQAATMVMTAGVSGVSLATFAKLAVGSHEKMREFYASMVRILSLLTIPIMAFTLVFAEDIILMLYSLKYVAAVSTLQILLGGRIASRFFGWGENAEYLLAIRKPGTVIAVGLVGAGATVFLHFLLIPRYGAIGAAWGAGFGALIANAAGYSRVRAVSGMRLQVRMWLVLVVCSLGVASLVHLVSVGGGSVTGLVIRLVAFVLFLLGALWIARPLPAGDLRRFSGCLGNFRPVHRVRNAILDMLMDAVEPALPPASAEETERGEQLRLKLSKIYPSVITPQWREFIGELRSGLLGHDPREFLQLPVARRVMFATNAAYIDGEYAELKKSTDWAMVWKSALRESGIGRPTRYWRDRTTSGNLIHQAYQMHRLKELTGCTACSVETVHEFGGGYGALCLLMQRAGFSGNYSIIDIPEMSLLQQYYLDAAGAVGGFGNAPGRFVRTNSVRSEDVSGVLARADANAARTLFVALWSLSEVPLEVRARVVPLISASGYVLLVYQEQFDGIDNVRYFEEMRQQLIDKEWFEESIPYQPGHRRLVARPARTKCI